MDQNLRYFLYIDLWGPLSKLDRDKIESAQKSFSAILQKVADPDVKTSNLLTMKAGDVVCALSSDFEGLLKFAMSLFQEVSVASLEAPSKELGFFSIRGAIAEGVNRLGDGTFVGLGSVDAAQIEKSGQRGSRLFVTRSLAEKASNAGFLVRASNARGLEHAEINWMKTRESRSFLESPLSSSTIGVSLQSKALEMIEMNDSYYQQLGSSLSELIKWSSP